MGAPGQSAASHDNFNKAREMFTQIGEQVPVVREFTVMLLGLAEDQTVFAEDMNAMNDPAVSRARAAILTHGLMT